MRAGKLNPLGGLLAGGFCSLSQCVKKKNGETWYQSHLADQELHQLLEKVDADLAQEAWQKGCLYCQGKLHDTPLRFFSGFFFCFWCRAGISAAGKAVRLAYDGLFSSRERVTL